jgi:hypothetical protein
LTREFAPLALLPVTTHWRPINATCCRNFLVNISHGFGGTVDDKKSYEEDDDDYYEHKRSVPDKKGMGGTTYVPLFI